MNGQSPTVFEQLREVDAAIDLATAPSPCTERLPFTVRVVQSEEDLMKAVRVRYESYGRHMPKFAQILREPEPDDVMPDAIVLLAESKLDGTPLGTARVQTNHERPLNMERSVQLPAWLQHQTLTETRRFGVTRGSEGGLVKMCLVKACYQYGVALGVDWGLLAARPPLNRGYQKLMFSDILGGNTFIPLPMENNVPHHVMAFEFAGAKVRWTKMQHPFAKFFFYIDHPDIDISAFKSTDFYTKLLKQSQERSAYAKRNPLHAGSRTTVTSTKADSTLSAISAL